MDTKLIVIVSVLILLILFVFGSRISKYDTEIWTKYGLKPVESADLDALMTQLSEEKASYAAATTIEDKITFRIVFEATRVKVQDWYVAKGKELGLNDGDAREFGRDMVLKNSI
jgi:hypothetical protein